MFPSVCRDLMYMSYLRTVSPACVRVGARMSVIMDTDDNWEACFTGCLGPSRTLDGGQAAAWKKSWVLSQAGVAQVRLSVPLACRDKDWENRFGGVRIRCLGGQALQFWLFSGSPLFVSWSST